MSTTINKNIIKVCIIGDEGVGKTTFIDRHVTGIFTRIHVPTSGCCTHPIRYGTNKGEIILNTWDISGQVSEYTCGYYSASSAFIVFFDLTNIMSFTNVKKWIEDARMAITNVPIILVGTKCDMRERKVTSEMIKKFLDTININSCHIISSKSNYNIEEPIIGTIRACFGDDTHFRTHIK